VTADLRPLLKIRKLPLRLHGFVFQHGGRFGFSFIKFFGSVTLHNDSLCHYYVRCYPLTEVNFKNTPFQVLIVLLSSGESSFY
jgi:hypothetical protein